MPVNYFFDLGIFWNPSPGWANSSGNVFIKIMPTREEKFVDCLADATENQSLDGELLCE